MTVLATNLLSHGDNLDNNIISRDEWGNATDSVDTHRHGVRTSVLHRAQACALLTIVVLAGACASSYQPTAAPTLAETRAYVTKMVELAQVGKFVQLCEMGGGNCERILETAGRGNVPVDPPTVARIYEVASVKHADGSWSQGGQMVEMCGVDRSGAAYQTQMIVFRDQTDHLIAIEPIYWSGLHIRVDAEQPVGPASSDPPFAC